MMKSIYHILGDKNQLMLRTIIILLFVSNGIQAAHILGGTMTYDIVGINNNQYEVEIVLELYRDPFGGGAEFDTQIDIGVYTFNGDYDLTTELTIPLSETYTEMWEMEENTTTYLTEIEIGVYKTTFELQSNNYVINYQRCCRRTNLMNIVAPNETGIQCRVNLYEEAFFVGSSGPGRRDEVIHKVKLDETDVLDISFYDENDDVLAYEFVPAFDAGGTAGATTPGSATDCDGVIPDPSSCMPTDLTVMYAGFNFSGLHPLGIDVEELDGQSGKLEMELSTAGNYLIHSKISEYNNGLLLSEIFYENVVSTISVTSSSDEMNTDERSATLSPNPVTESIYLKSDKKVVEIYLLGVSGEWHDCQLQDEHMNVGFLPSGMHVLKIVYSSNETEYLKFVKL